MAGVSDARLCSWFGRSHNVVRSVFPSRSKVSSVHVTAGAAYGMSRLGDEMEY